MNTTDRDANPFRARMAWIPVLMSGAALALVLGYLQTGPHPPNMVIENGIARQDEGAAARLWQLLIVLQFPLIGWFGLRWLPRAPRLAIAVLACQAFAIVAAALPVLLLES
jgi:hypothetical protein